MKRILALAIVLALAAAACGDSGGTTTAPTETTTGGADTTASPPTPDPPATTTAPASGVGVSFTGADGVTSEVGDTSRIVSLTGDITETIFALGRGEQVVAIDVTTTFPPEAVQLPQVGFGQMLAAEPVLAFEPTLVIGDQTIGPPEVLEQLRGAGIPVVILETQTTLEGIATKITQIAEILGAEGDGEALIAQVSQEIDAARALAAEQEGSPNVAYVYVRGPQTILVFGAGMPTQAMIEGAGATDVGAALVPGPAPLTPESIVAAAPDVIVLPEAGLGALGGIEAFEALPGVSETPAAATDAYLVYDEAYFFNLGPRAGQALMEFVEDLYELTS